MPTKTKDKTAPPNKTETIFFRVTPQQLRRIETAAKRMGLLVGQYVRSLALKASA